MVKKLYSVWIKTDEALPWIEIKGEYLTKSEARKAAEEAINRIKIKIVALPEKRKIIKALAPLRVTR